MFIPVYDNVVVEPIEDNDKVGSLYIPDTAKEKPMKGKVVQVGSGYTENGKLPVEIDKGDIILYNKNVGVDYTIDDKKYVFIKLKDIFTIIK